MADPFVGEIRLFAGNFAPLNWAFCAGQILPISEYTPLYSLIGTIYGGDGQTTFALPNLQGRVPVHMGTAKDGTVYTIGQIAGTENVTLNLGTIPSHTHTLSSTGTGQQQAPGPTARPATATSSQSGIAIYGPLPPGGPTNLIPQSIGLTGQSLAHENRQPYLAVNFIISLFGIFPSQN